MAESQSPILCVTCQRSFPDDLKADDAPKYFCQGPLLPQSDSAHDFASEVQRMLWYIKAISEALRYGDNKDLEEDTYNNIFELVGEISEEALRRLNLSFEATWEIDKRAAEAKKATQARKEGRA